MLEKMLLLYTYRCMVPTRRDHQPMVVLYEYMLPSLKIECNHWPIDQWQLCKCSILCM